MANTRLFDSWQIGMDLPAPFDRAIDGGVRYSTKEEDCSCYNKAIRGKKQHSLSHLDAGTHTIHPHSYFHG